MRQALLRGGTPKAWGQWGQWGQHCALVKMSLHVTDFKDYVLVAPNLKQIRSSV